MQILLSFLLKLHLSRLFLFALIAFLLTGCATMYSISHWSTLLVTRPRSPVFVSLPYVNGPLEDAERSRVRGEFSSDLADDPLVRDMGLLEGDRDRMVMVSFSGGGARASVFSAFVMRELERAYNDLHAQSGQGGEGDALEDIKAAEVPPMIDRLDAISGVSGGAIYASYIAVLYSLNEAGYNNLLDELEFIKGRDPGARREAFTNLVGEYFHSYAYFGGRAGCSYLSPTNLCLGPLAGLRTDADLVDLYALYLDTDYVLGVLTRLKMRDLKPRPRFFFNAATSQFRPMIFTQSGYRQGPAASVDKKGAPEDALLSYFKGTPSVFQPGRPFAYALTLEDLNSSADDFPISYSVMASAAYPGAMEPLELEKYAEGENGELEYNGFVNIVDGGLYENFGITTALETFNYIQRRLAEQNRPLKLTLLSINNANPERETEAQRSAWTDPRGIIGVDTPIRGLTPAVQNAFELYNDRYSWITKILRDHLATREDVLFIDVNLADCPELQADPELDVQTNYVINAEEIETLRACAEAVMRQKQDGMTKAELFVRNLD